MKQNMNIVNNSELENLMKQILKIQIKINLFVGYIYPQTVSVVGMKNNLAYFACINSLISVHIFALNNQIKLVKKLQTNKGNVSFFYLKKSDILILIFDRQLHMMEHDINQNWKIKQIVQFTNSAALPSYIPKIAKWNLNENFLAILAINYYFLFKNSENDWKCFEIQKKSGGNFLGVLSDSVIINRHANEITFDKIIKHDLHQLSFKSFAKIEQKTRCATLLLGEQTFVVLKQNLNLLIFWKICLVNEEVTKLQELDLNLQNQQTCANFNVQDQNSKDLLLLVQNCGSLYVVSQNDGVFFVEDTILEPKLNIILIQCKRGEYLFSKTSPHTIMDQRTKVWVYRLCAS